MDEADNTETHKLIEDDDDEVHKLLVREEAIRQILTLCAEYHVNVPEELKIQLLGGDTHGHATRDPRSNRSVVSVLIEQRASELAQLDDDKLIKEIRDIWRQLKATPPHVDVRIKDGSYRVTNYFDVMQDALSGSRRGHLDDDDNRKRSTQNIQTVASANPLWKAVKRILYFLKTGDLLAKKRSEETIALDGINLKFESGKMYLILGAPKSGKSTLLKMIANTLTKGKDHVVGGEVTINGASPGGDVVWSNLAVYIDQIDRLHPYLTVKETCEFAWNCRSGGTHWRANYGNDEEVMKLVEKLDKDLWLVHTILQGMGLSHVKDTFVGDQQNVRGVSGGEKKRVTVAEMMVVRTPVVCCDEISTGLDAATTYDIIKLLGAAGRLTGAVRIVSLLQPPPETFALFDDLILLHGGRVIYSGPVDEAVEHFQQLGYRLPDRMDVADWLLAIPTKDGAQFRVEEDLEAGNEPPARNHFSPQDLQRSFNESQHGKATMQELVGPQDTELIELYHHDLAIKFNNSWWTYAKLLVSRELLLWWRDRYQIRARIMQDVIMGVVSGTVFWQASDDAQSVMGILFQSMFFVSLGAMLKVPFLFDVRSIFYKHQDANFFPTWAYVLGKTIAGLPTSIIDSLVYGTIIYWFVGLAYNKGASVANYFVFLLLMFVTSTSAGLIFSIIGAVVKDRTTGQAFMSVSIVILVLFSGFTVQADVIPDYWIWVYWINMFGWMLRGLAVNEFDSGKYDTLTATGKTIGEEYLSLFGFTLNGKPFTFEWMWWGVLVSLGLSIMSVIATIYFLSALRFEPGKPLATGDFEEEEEDDADEIQQKIPFQQANLTFKNIHYTVKASTSDEKLELLKGVDGFVEAGKMTALMGSSGAGKTTLMDVLALRKTSGEIVGEVFLNGHPIEPKVFRRCTGYVEQFDVQSPQLTIRETVLFSARLRLEESDPAVTPESTQNFIDQTLKMLELKPIEDLQVGDDQSGGLSFEQRKRLSIAVELVSNPSVLFLDEPTSGLDARSAAIVMRGLKKIALSGRAVCATIHQPSNAIFHSFDNLLLLKRGGEVVFFGELGVDSHNLISYLERFPSTPHIQPGENPATWMLTTIGAGSSPSGRKFDYAESYESSLLRKECLARIDSICAAKTDGNKLHFPHKYATSDHTQRIAVMRKIMRIYWRSPSYNATRLMVSAVIALLFGSVYVSQRNPTNEGDLNSRVTSIFISTIFLAVNSFNSVLSVFEVERNMFYRHKAALMYNQKALVLALTVAEIPFILLSSLIFVAIFYFMVGFAVDAGKFFLYYLFFTLYIGAFTFLGQMMVSLFRDSVTAQGFGGLIISFTSMFSGVLIRPNNIPTFWIFAYWLFPGHYALEGLLASQFKDDHTKILASPGSKFFVGNNCTSVPCYGTAEDWINISFGGKFEYDHIKWNILYMIGLVVGARVITYIALTRLNFAVH